MLGLLEDMHILFDGHPPRKCGPHYFENGPHIGKVYDHLQRQPFYYQAKDDTFELEPSDEENQKPNVKMRNFITQSNKKQAKQIDIRNYSKGRNDKVKKSNTESESNVNFRVNTLQDSESGANTNRQLIKHENVPSIINNQIGSDLCSPIAKIKEKNHNFILSPKPENDTFDDSKIVPKELKMSEFRSADQPQKVSSHNNQMSSAVSGAVSPEPLLPQRRTDQDEDESILTYTEKSRSEELSELENDKQAALMEYAQSKKEFSSMQNNPFYIESKRPDIDPFKEILQNYRENMKSSCEVDDIQQMYDEEAMFMNRISNLKEFRKLVQEYSNMGVDINTDMSLDSDSLNEFQDGTLI